MRVFWEAENKVEHQNFATIQWQDRHKTFLIKTEAAARDVKKLSLQLIRDPLPARLKLSKDIYMENKTDLMGLFENAAILIKARNGGITL